jgi:hypothetical protein
MSAPSKRAPASVEPANDVSGSPARKDRADMLKTKEAVVASAKASADGAAEAADRKARELDAAQAKLASAEAAFTRDQTDANANALSKAVHAQRIAKVAADDAAAQHERARAIHASAAKEIERSRAEVARADRIEDLEALVARGGPYDVRVAGLARTAMGLAGRLLDALDQIHAATVDVQRDAEELARLKGEAPPKLRGSRVAIAIVEELIARGASNIEQRSHNFAASPTTPAWAWASGFVGALIDAWRSPPPSQAQQAANAELLAALRGTDNWIDCAHALVLHRQTSSAHRRPLPL